MWACLLRVGGGKCSNAGMAKFNRNRLVRVAALRAAADRANEKARTETIAVIQAAVGAGLKHGEIGDSIGMSGSRVGQILKAARR